MKKWEDWEVNYLLENHKIYTILEMSQHLNRSKTSVAGKMQMMKLSGKKNRPQKYNYNRGYFQDIDTEEKAYWLGFLYADGCVHARKGGGYRLKVALKESDSDHLVKLVKSIEGDIPIRIKQSNNHKYCELVINSNEICECLIKYGVVPNKTYAKCKLPNISKQLIKHFIRGYCDGDGCLYSNKNKKKHGTIEFVSYDNGFLNELQSYFKSMNIDSNIYIKRKDNVKLLISKFSSVCDFIDKFYINSNIYLDRKYERSIYILNKLKCA